MWRTLFLSIIHKLIETSTYFSERYDATSRVGLTALQKCTAVVRHLASIGEERCEVCFRSYSQCTLGLIMRVCIMLHNMIIDNETDDDYDENYHTVTFIIAPPVTYEAPASFTTILQRETHLISGLMFLNLQSDLIEHVWNKFH
jgi:hypothetical protein